MNLKNWAVIGAIIIGICLAGLGLSVLRGHLIAQHSSRDENVPPTTQPDSNSQNTAVLKSLTVPAVDESLYISIDPEITFQYPQKPGAIWIDTPQFEKVDENTFGSHTVYEYRYPYDPSAGLSFINKPASQFWLDVHDFQEGTTTKEYIAANQYFSSYAIPLETSAITGYIITNGDGAEVTDAAYFKLKGEPYSSIFEMGNGTMFSDDEFVQIVKSVKRIAPTNR